MTARAFVVGHPIRHSRSPLIHGHWLAEHGLAGTYERLDVAPDDFAAFFRALPASGFAGGNVTIPHKEAAFRLADSLTERAKKIGAVNTLIVEGGRVRGDNTDAPGFIAHLDRSLGEGWPERPAQQYATQYEQRGYDPRGYDPYASQYQPEVPTHVSGGEGRRPRRRKAKAPGCLALLTTLIVLIVAGTLFMDSRLTRIDALPATQIPNTAGTNWLLVGSDSRTGMSEKDAERLGTGGDIGSSRTDTIMLLHLPTTGSATLVSIPRDSYVEVPGYGYDKVNAAFAYGGPKLLASTVEQATGLHIDRYAEIGMGGLANAVDAVGGVEICVKEAINDPLANLNVQPGCQEMDGATGLGYVRTRATAQGDLDRVERQREFLAALMDKVTSPAVLVNPIRMISLAWTTPTLFAVGQNDHIWNLARIPLAMRGGLETKTIPVGGFMDTEVGSVVVWDDAGAQQLFDSLR